MRILLSPTVRPGRGSGHLRRCLRLTRRLGEGSAVLLEGERGAQALAGLELEGPRPEVRARFAREEPWDLILLDRWATSLEELQPFAGLPAAGLDEGGPARRYLPFLIDTPLGSSFGHSPNLTSAAFLELPARSAVFRFPFRRVLLSFGGEDAPDLSGRLLEGLLRGRLFPPQQLTVVQGPFFRRTTWPAGLQVLVNPRELKAILPDYDLVLTLFGLTAFEARAAGVPTILFNPSRYHRRLARESGFPEIGVLRPRLRKLKALLADRAVFEPRLSEPAGASGETAGQGGGPVELLASLLPAGPVSCPVCRSAPNPAAARFERRTFLRCRACGLLYQVIFGERAPSYGPGYFLEEYRRQYGRTYLEDFEAILRTGHARLRILRRLLPRKGPAGRPPRLLDIGCAYGPFLQACREQGLQAEGCELSEEAARYVREQLGIPCRTADFEKEGPGFGPAGGYQVVSMWYVLEHFRDPASVLRSVNRLLAPGGLLALSTPNAAGVSARRDREAFLRASPEDHGTVWSPAAARRILRRFGFRLRRVRVTGHHPERFPPLLPPWALSALSRLLRLGDTFEAYAVKIGDPE